MSPPKKDRPGWEPGQHKVSVDWTTAGSYTSTAQTSSALLRLACAALSADELNEWLTRSRREARP